MNETEPTQSADNTPASRPANGAPTGEAATRDLMARVAFASLIEQRRARRWGVFFKCLLFAYLFFLLLLVVLPDGLMAGKSVGGSHVALVKIHGVIAADQEASADNVIQGLRAALEDDTTAGVILDINSPGGSPVQAGEIYDMIVKLRREHDDIPIHAVISDVGASGGYYVAAAAQNIYANQASIVGSIGVRTDSFGFTQAMDKLGVERRLYTAGEHKGFLDPFSPPDPQDVAHLKNLLGQIHRQFIDAVEMGRGERLRPAPELYSGLVWTGEQGVELGLVDDLASVRQVAEEVIGVERVVDYTHKRLVLERFLGSVEGSLERVLGRLLGFGGALR